MHLVIKVPFKKKENTDGRIEFFDKRVLPITGKRRLIGYFYVDIAMITS
ncbi:hypothetical protein [Bacillus sp. AFS031507]|nr:hypothetical protein [Bacillus sp. AFS031507]